MALTISNALNKIPLINYLVEFCDQYLKPSIQNHYQTIKVYLSNIITWYNLDKNKFVRCTHNKDFDENFNDLIAAHNNSLEELNNNERVMIGTSDSPINLGANKITIDIPMIFHLLDPALSANNINYWTTHINTKIIPQLNKDYNISYANFSLEHIKNVNTLFANADPSKKNYYLNLVKILPTNANLQWKFSLNKIIIKPVSGLSITSSNNDNVFKATAVENPESFLNVIVVPGTQILGISVFPFSDRNPSNTSQIDPNYAYRNAILINTAMFKGTSAPFDKFRTFTHEFGHWCGLLHPFDNISFRSTDVTKFGLNKLNFDKTPVKLGEVDQDFVGDLIADTAPQTKPTYGTIYDKVTITKKRVGKIVQDVLIRNTPYAYIFEKNDLVPNFYNFMDYTDDAQMCMFTQLQVLHMVYMLSKFRPNFVKSA